MRRDDETHSYEVDRSNREFCRPVEEALMRVGDHGDVPFEVDRVMAKGARSKSLLVELTLRFLEGSPVCCRELGCYIPFLGHRIEEVPAAIASALGFDHEPEVEMVVRAIHEPGYRSIEFGPVPDFVVRYSPADFRLP